MRARKHRKKVRQLLIDVRTLNKRYNLARLLQNKLGVVQGLRVCFKFK